MPYIARLGRYELLTCQTHLPSLQTDLLHHNGLVRQLASEDFGKLLELPLTEAKAELVDRFERQAITQAL